MHIYRRGSIYMHIYICIYMHMNMHMICIFKYRQIWHMICLYMDMHIYAYHMHMYICIYIHHMSIFSIFAYINKHIYRRGSINMHIWQIWHMISLYMDMHIYAYHMHMYICIYIHHISIFSIFAYINMHIYRRGSIYMHI